MVRAKVRARKVVNRAVSTSAALPSTWQCLPQLPGEGLWRELPVELIKVVRQANTS